MDRFWEKWRELAGPNLFIRPKWHRTERNVKVGDLVWIADTNALGGQFPLGCIVTVYPDIKGIVRDADIATCAGLPVSQTGGHKKSSLLPMTVIRRDEIRLVVLLPVEDQICSPTAMVPFSSYTHSSAPWPSCSLIYSLNRYTYLLPKSQLPP